MICLVGMTGLEPAASWSCHPVVEVTRFERARCPNPKFGVLPTGPHLYHLSLCLSGYNLLFFSSLFSFCVINLQLPGSYPPESLFLPSTYPSPVNPSCDDFKPASYHRRRRVNCLVMLHRYLNSRHGSLFYSQSFRYGDQPTELRSIPLTTASYAQHAAFTARHSTMCYITYLIFSML